MLAIGTWLRFIKLDGLEIQLDLSNMIIQIANYQFVALANARVLASKRVSEFSDNLKRTANESNSHL